MSESDEEWDEEVYPVIIDCGTYTTKCGYNDQSTPYILPTLLAKIDWRHPILGSPRDIHIDKEAINNLTKSDDTIFNKYTAHYPMQKGIIHSSDDMERFLWEVCFNVIRTDPSEHPILLTEKTLNPKENRLKTAQIMLECLNVASLYLAKQSELSLFATGKSTGIVLDFGYDTIECVPIYEGYALKDAVTKIDIGGLHVTEDLIMKQRLISKEHYSFMYLRKYSEIMEKMGYVAIDHGAELDKNICKEYTNDAGDFGATLKNEIFECFEILFNGDGSQTIPVHEMIEKSVSKCDVNMNDLLQNIVVNGGLSMVPGMVERLDKEISNIFPKKDDVLINGYARNYEQDQVYKDVERMINDYSGPITGCNIIGHENRDCLSWIGGSMFSMTDTFDEGGITIDEWAEIGPSIVERKFL